MKKYPQVDPIPDGKREELDFIGHAYCPIKERFKNAYDIFEAKYNSEHETKLRGVIPMGSCGADIYDNLSAVGTESKFPFVLTESGYGEFITDGFLTDERKQSWFSAPALPERINPLFRGLNLADPKGLFTVYGAMPYILLVNRKKLGGRNVPRKIADLASPEYENAVAVGYAPDDITELLLMEIHSELGDSGIRQLARNIALAGNAQQLIQSAISKDDGRSVYLMSRFFANAAPKHGEIELIWPEDGALFCPLYILARKAESPEKNAVLDFLFGKDLGQAMADGWFAHINADVGHNVPEYAKFRWVGWDYIYETDFTKRINGIEKIYYGEKPLG